MLNRRALLAGMAALALPRAAYAQSPFDAQAQVQAAGLGGAVAFAVIDPETGHVLASRDADAPLPPASTLKLVTTLYALDRLGPAHRFQTRVLRRGEALVLAGGGDPVLDTDALGRLAKATAQGWQGAAPTRFLVWGGALPRIDRLSASQDEHLPYNPTISGMILNFNRVHLSWRAGQMSLEARGGKLSPRAYTVTAAATDRRLPLFAYQDGGARESWTVARAALRQPGARWLPVRHPELYAGDVFQTLCRAQGLVLPTPEIADQPPEGRQLAQEQSPALSLILRDMLEYSTNLTAEVLGLAASAAPGLAASTTAMSDWMRGLDPAAEFAFHDHSGLSPDNRVTAMTLARLLAGPGRSRDLAALLKRIPLKEKTQPDPAIQVRAKTGTLNFVSNLAGYATPPQGRPLAFAILGADEPRRAATEGQELPEGVIGWTRRAKRLQQDLIRGWCEPA
ncbi:MAG: D-alanyl-D-alanine carboxypeptidase/D-alanyl-D-alanine-endopeptidase [Paracoccus sp. (in: a-proteobacteria)]|uniref:D-alanyl-D-alanine carboxypeptidase/D-alanyl-D-alanine endopeptidase n=1 Tax=Paracoccus sp. TaxID=267 RepID=UPI0039E6D168